MDHPKCQNCAKEFAIDSDDLEFYAKLQVPSPTFCPLCRAQRRHAFRNERGWYKRKSDATGNDIFSMYSPESPVKVYERDLWLSDTWDATDYGRDIDWSRPFLSQLYELMLDVPFKASNVIRGVGSEYSNNATDPKNCYLVFNATNPEDCMYCNGVNFSRDCVDCSHISKTESSYGSFWLTSCYRTHFSSQCADSSDLWFSRDCQGCISCFGCVNLRKKSYCFFNEQCASKEEYDAKVAAYRLGTREGIEQAKADAMAFWKQFPSKNHQGLKNIDCTGSYVTNSKNVRDSFCVRESENLRYCQSLQETPGAKDCYDYSIWGDGAELVYESTSCGTGVQNIKFSLLTQESVHDTEYTIGCQSSEYLFGCVGLRKKEYCILNKRYEKEEYFELVKKIRQHMKDMPYVDAVGRTYASGEFLPIEMSPWAYTETLAQEYFPLTKEEALAQGYRWRDTAARDHVATLRTEEIPADIAETDDAITKEIIECAHKGTCNHGCTKAFRILPDELSYYRKIGVPVPTLCHACRTMERLTIRLGLELYDEKCMCGGTASNDGAYENMGAHEHGTTPCPNTFQTGYAPDSGTIVYCETCYQQEAV